MRVVQKKTVISEALFQFIVDVSFSALSRPSRINLDCVPNRTKTIDFGVTPNTAGIEHVISFTPVKPAE